MNSGLKTYRDLVAWQRGIDLVEQVYQITGSFPSEEKYGLARQMRRAAVSIPSNMAEGYGRTHRKEYLQHLSFSRGSLMELETQLTIAVRLAFLPKERAMPGWALTQEVGRLLNGLIGSLQLKRRGEEDRDASELRGNAERGCSL